MDDFLVDPKFLKVIQSSILQASKLLARSLRRIDV
jgi:hypothetical protein